MCHLATYHFVLELKGNFWMICICIKITYYSWRAICVCICQQLDLILRNYSYNSLSKAMNLGDVEPDKYGTKPLT